MTKSERKKAMQGTGKFLEGFILGGLVGVAVALLVTPASGNELRSRIQTEVDRVRGEVNRAAEERRSELEQQLAALRMPH
jgi:gas vesicle protein